MCSYYLYTLNLKLVKVKTDTSVLLKDVSKWEKSRYISLGVLHSAAWLLFFYFKLCYVSRYLKEDFSAKHWYRIFEEWPTLSTFHILFFKLKKTPQLFKHELYCIVQCFSVYILGGIIDWVKTKRWILLGRSQNNLILKYMRKWERLNCVILYLLYQTWWMVFTFDRQAC